MRGIRSRRDRSGALGALLTVALSSACAFTTERLTLPTQGLAQPLSGGRGRQVIVVAPFADERQIRDRCGMKKNGYNMDTADAVCQSDPNVWIATLLARELKTAGFTVVDEKEVHRPGALRVQGALLKIFVEPIIGAWSGSLEADVSIRLDVTTETGLVATRTFFVKGWKGGQQIIQNAAYHQALDRASQALLDEMVRAILELADRYPQLGRIDASPAMLAASRS